MNSPLISIVIPTFNRSESIPKTVESVLNQTYSNWELIIVDDGSNESTIKLLSMYVSDHDNIKLFKRSKFRVKGANSCRNIGIENSIGEYIAFLDSDDFWMSLRLERLVEFINQTKSLAIYSGATDQHIDKSCFRKSRPIGQNESSFDFLIANDTYAPTPSLVVHLSLLKVVRFDELLNRHQDYDFYIKIHSLFHWCYMESNDIIVNRKESKRRKVDFNSCVNFYDRYKQISKDKNVRIGYLEYISESCAKINPSKSAINYFISEIKREKGIINIRQWVILYFPVLFHYAYILKIKING